MFVKAKTITVCRVLINVFRRNIYNHIKMREDKERYREEFCATFEQVK